MRGGGILKVILGDTSSLRIGVGLTCFFVGSICLPDNAKPIGNLAEVAVQDGITPKSETNNPRSTIRWDTL